MKNLNQTVYLWMKIICCISHVIVGVIIEHIELYGEKTCNSFAVTTILNKKGQKAIHLPIGSSSRMAK